MAQLAQRMRQKDKFLWYYKGGVFDDDETILFTSPALFGPSLVRRASISSCIPSPGHSLILFNLSIPDDILDGLLFAFFVSWHG